MGLVTLPGTQIQYFSFSEEVQAIGAKFFAFIFNITPGWILFITAISLAFIILGVFYLAKREIKQMGTG
jgi:hypothetical protein